MIDVLYSCCPSPESPRCLSQPPAITSFLSSHLSPWPCPSLPALLHLHTTFLSLLPLLLALLYTLLPHLVAIPNCFRALLSSLSLLTTAEVESVLTLIPASKPCARFSDSSMTLYRMHYSYKSCRRSELACPSSQSDTPGCSSCSALTAPTLAAVVEGSGR